MKTSIVGFDFDSGTTTVDPDAATLIRWAAAAHLEDCPQCKRGEEACPTGQLLDDAARPDRSWIPDPTTGA